MTFLPILVLGFFLGMRHATVGAVAGMLSLIFGIYLVYQIGFVDGLFR